jgi:RHS repeat-associated protein
VTTRYLDGLWEESPGESHRAIHYAFNGEIVAQRDGANHVVFLHTDHLGSIGTVSRRSASGASEYVEGQRFQSWGTRWEAWGAGVTVTTLNYTGQRRDDTGLLYYHARSYDPALGRFISPDTIVPGAGPLTAFSCP